MTFLPELYFSRQKLFLLIKWVHNDFMYVRFAGMRHTKTCQWGKSNKTQIISDSGFMCYIRCFLV